MTILSWVEEEVERWTTGNDIVYLHYVGNRNVVRVLGYGFGLPP